MSNIIYVTSGEKLGKAGAFLMIYRNDEELKLELDDIEAIILESQWCSITVGAHIMCSQKEVPIIICNEKHQPEVFCHSIYSYYQLTLRIKDQTNWQNLSIKDDIFAKIVQSKIQHQLNLLTSIKENEELTAKFTQYINKLDEERLDNLAETAESITARMYFKALFGLKFKRGEDDVINAGLNYGYMLIRAVIMTKIVAKGFHPSLGIWHHGQFNNYNFADDIIEIFRPIVDYIVFHRILSSQSFEKDERMILQNILLQEVDFAGNRVDLKQAISLYLDAINKTFQTNDISNLEIPKLDVNYYEY
ncbi:MAG: type II CRISPR-associated endonuclease Cas1 [Culicoidibacterales bacterium]